MTAFDFTFSYYFVAKREKKLENRFTITFMVGIEKF